MTGSTNEKRVGHGRIRLVQGDITRQRADALVTAANAGLRGGGGVDGAIHAAAGAELLQACRALGGCPTGSAASTPAFGLEDRGVRRVIHAVGPRWKDGASGEHDLLRGAYGRALEIAEEDRCASVAFPSISTGIYAFPVAEAAPLALAVAREHLEHRAVHVKEILFVLFDDATYGPFAAALAAMDG